MRGKKILSAFIALVLIAGLPVAAFAETWDIANGDITINAPTEGEQTVSQGERQNVSDSNPTITGSSTTNTVTISADAGATANVKLEDVSIDVSNNGKAAISTTGDGDVTIELEGDSSVKSGGNHAGLEKANGGNLTIKDDDNDGKLTAVGDGAGIGSRNDSYYSDNNVSNITIKGGTINATGGGSAAGIGGGGNGSASNITIEGGDITAKGGWSGAGIGAGGNCGASNITITGGKVTAIGGLYAAGIGGGISGDGSNITISGDVQVTAVGGESGAGIGGGRSGEGSNIKISGDAQVKVKGGTPDKEHRGEGAAIGNGGRYYNNAGDEVTPDTSGLTVDGNIYYYKPGADIENDEPTETITGKLPSTRPKPEPEPEQPAEPKAEAAPAPGESAPLYRVTDKDGKDLAYKYEKNNGVLTATVEAEYAVLTGSLSGINTLSQQGIEELVFITNGATSTYKLAELLDMGSLSDGYALTHDGATATLTVG